MNAKISCYLLGYSLELLHCADLPLDFGDRKKEYAFAETEMDTFFEYIYYIFLLALSVRVYFL